MMDPIDGITWMDATDLHDNHYNPNRVHRAEMRLLEHSLLSTGWIQPIIVNRDLLIVDGFHRWRLSQDSKVIQKRWNGKVPVAVLDVDRPSAMMMTIRINRAKGTHVAVEMSRVVHELLDDHGCSKQEIAKEIGATIKEVELLAQDGVFQAANIKDHAYSPAWYPVEVRK